MLHELFLFFVESVTAPKPELNSGRNELKDLTPTGSVEEGPFF